MTQSPLFVVIATAVLIVLSAFFVIIEFALLAARRPRLEADAATSLRARAALRGMNELTIMLAVAQFGITICTFALGAITKPAVDAGLSPIFAAWGAPDWLADSGAFMLALLFVTFLHLVIGEMAPKSWAIAHPEAAASAVSLPARGLAWLLRPLLVWINRIANRLVAASGYSPAESRSTGGQNVEAIRHLVEHSAAVGTLDDAFRAQLAQVLDLERLTVADLLPAEPSHPAAVQQDATAADVRDVAAVSGHLRVLVERRERTPGVVHVRDLLLHDDDARIDDLVREPLEFAVDLPAHAALARMRQSGRQFAVATRDGVFVGVVTMSDVLRRVLPNGAGLRL
ncbi:CNNM domain-containing protein [Pseudoclavibacter sp. 13-3]|uniref:CNNM domain-containing protein n=1 Tax=Pseudoclavibacter sp. 13-3 TaxID=2901228 RepID=UPI001E60F82E|nr:hemolysin family protein [Pseudoclavibacter sp. 13-3]MCD7100838.1 hemolysin family protein [Pseudoclavibacter sp. 13-3]